MGFIRYNGQTYSTVDSFEISYKQDPQISVGTALEDIVEEIDEKPTLKLIDDEDYVDKNDNVVYFINDDTNYTVGANNASYDNNKSKAMAVNVQDAIDVCYMESLNGKSALVDVINANGGNVAVTTPFETLDSTLQNIAEDVYNDTYNEVYDIELEANKVGTAVAADVLVGKTFSNTSGSGINGAMPNHGAVNKTFSPSSSAQSYQIPAGYHNGSGKVSLNASDIVTKSTLSYYLSHRHYKSYTATTDMSVQGYNTLSKTMSDTANTASASIIGYKPDGSTVTISTTIGNQSGINIAPYYKIRIQSTAASVDDVDHHIKYIGQFTFTV